MKEKVKEKNIKNQIYVRLNKKIIVIVIMLIFLTMILFTTTSKATNSEDIRNGIQIEDNLLQDKQLSYAGITSYDSRRYYDTLVFDQQQTGTCWDNAALMQLTLATDYGKKGRYVFSRRHAALKINGTMEEGGFFESVAAYITCGMGPILEMYMPWKSITSENSKNMKATDEEEILLKTKKPDIKVNSWEKLPTIRKYIDNNGKLQYYQPKNNEQISYEYTKKYSEFESQYKMNWSKIETLKSDRYTPVNRINQIISEYEEYVKYYKENNIEGYVQLYEDLISIYKNYDRQETTFEEYCNKNIKQIENRNKEIFNEISDLNSKEVKKIATVLSEEEVNNRRKKIKNYIMNYGGVEAIIGADFGISGLSDDGGYGYKGFKYNLYKMDETANHEVVLIGWDDNFSIDNFPEDSRPTKPGAYLVQNSWGKEWGNEGCFWVSYEDMNIEAGRIGRK